MVRRQKEAQMDTDKFLTQFQDHLAPKMDVYEQAIYLYLIRHSRLIGKEEVVVGFKSARKQLAFGVGKARILPSERICYYKVRFLKSKSSIKALGTEHTGTRIHPYLPHEISDLIESAEELAVQSLGEMDFFDVPENRELVLLREKHQCFYCRAKLTKNTYVIEHVISRPVGDNSNRNVVAACRQCNNRKGSSDVKEYLRTLYRDGFLAPDEFEARLSHLELLSNGEHKPEILTANNRLKPTADRGG